MTATPEQLYYVQDTRQIVGNCALWWCPEGLGYTCEIDRAGLYTEDEVRHMRATDMAWPRELVDRLIVRHVRMDTMRQAPEWDAVKEAHAKAHHKVTP